MELDIERIKRYEEKIEFLHENFKLLEEWLPSNLKEFLRDVKIRKAIYKVIQELTDYMMDVVAMIVKDEGKVVRDDYTNLYVPRQPRITIR